MSGEEKDKIREFIKQTRYEFEELDNFLALFENLTHVKVNEVSTESINEVFYSILSTSKSNQPKEKLVPLTQDTMMATIPNSD